MSPQRSMWPNDVLTNAVRVDATVHWACRKASHRAAPSRGGRGGLTVHQGRWAYCDGMVQETDHEWVPTGGVSIDRLIDWSKALDPLRAHTVRP
jgi:hypothetical protein